MAEKKGAAKKGAGKARVAKAPRVKVRQRREVFNRFFRIVEAEFDQPKLDGSGVIKNVKRLVFERGDSAAALVHVTDRDVVVLTEQFRFPTYDKGPGIILEAMAGSISDGEDPEACIRREMLEEIGYEAKKLEKIAHFYVSPGGTSERIFLYYAPVTTADLVNPDACGVAHEHEDIRRVEVSTKRFIDDALNARLNDAKLLVAGLWLAARTPAPAKRKTPTKTKTKAKPKKRR
ncbi:NUDIX hydrolase [Vitreimonas sp.]|uniref:NUDIX hydrolase n=1 Tax=Vitreimonas sp. TaxID=3069702 RepID=UPI002D778913|nr:NUDIX hydrolase [Vitreimonas sp.]